MKTLVISDLHLDFWDDEKVDIFAECGQALADLDLLLIAGDLSNKPKVRWPKYLAQLTSVTKPGVVKIFGGNHDFYQFRIDDEPRMAKFASDAGAEYINRKTVICGTTRYICATLWTDFNLAPGRAANEAHIPTRMNDYKCIRNAAAGFRRLLPKDTIAIHQKDLAFIAAELAKPFAGTTTVVTHHAPHPDVMTEYGENLDAAYASNLEEFILTHKPDRWLFGHCHNAHNIKVGTCQLKNVSLGYPDDVKNPTARIMDLIESSS